MVSGWGPETEIGTNSCSCWDSGKDYSFVLTESTGDAVVALLFLLGWPWKKRPVWLSTASAEATFGPMCNPVCVLGCLHVWVVCGYCHTDNACVVSVRALYCIFIVPSPAASFSRYQACVSMPDRHRATQAHPPSQQGHSGLVLRWPDAVHTT